MSEDGLGVTQNTDTLSTRPHDQEPTPPESSESTESVQPELIRPKSIQSESARSESLQSEFVQPESELVQSNEPDSKRVLKKASRFVGRLFRKNVTTYENVLFSAESPTVCTGNCNYNSPNLDFKEGELTYIVQPELVPPESVHQLQLESPPPQL